MAEVSIKYKGNTIAEMNEDAQKTLKTGGTYCEADIEVDYVRPVAAPVNCKRFSFSSDTAVAVKYTTVVSGDPDVAAHYADATAMVTIHKISNVDTNGIGWACAGNIKNGNNYGVYHVYNATSSANSSSNIQYPLSQQSGQTSGLVHIICTESGDIEIMCNRTQANFGGADYIVTFAW